jgi:drug/metabolite transporter (DMT)-like permease
MNALPSKPPEPATLPVRTLWQGSLLGLGAAFIWGTYLAFARAGEVAGLHPADLALLRYGIAGLILLPWLLRHHPLSLAGVGWRRAAVLSLLAGPPFVLISAGGYAFAPLAHGAVFQPAGLTLGSMLLAALMLGDRPTASRIGGAALVLVGLLIIANPSSLQGDPSALLGDAMFFAAGSMWAVFSVLLRRWGISPLAATAAVGVLSALVYVPWFVGTHTFEALGALSWTQLIGQVIVQGVLSGVVAVIAYSRAVQLLGAARAGVFAAAVPLVAIVVGGLLTGEAPTAMQLIGIGVVLLGLLAALEVIKVKRHAVNAAAPALCTARR